MIRLCAFFVIVFIGSALPSTARGTQNSTRQVVTSRERRHVPNPLRRAEAEAEDFVPDTLSKEEEDDSDDDDVHEPSKEKPPHEETASLRSEQAIPSLHGSNAQSANGHSAGRLLVTGATSTSSVQRPDPSELERRPAVSAVRKPPIYGKTVASIGPVAASLLPVAPSVGTISATRRRNDSQPYADEEETKLKRATNKLVKWLRNRLHKRLHEVADLEGQLETEKNLLVTLNKTIENESLQRHDEIKKKLQTQKRLTDFRRHSDEPEREMNKVTDNIKDLTEQLTGLKKTYESLAAARKELRDRLLSAGFGHWLDARGKEYMPATAVGVLSKSAHLLDPVSYGFKEAVLLDEAFSSEVESVVPTSDLSLLAKVVWDLAMLMPLIPFLLVMRHISLSLSTLSVFHIVMYIAGVFAIESVLMLLLSLCMGREALGVLQQSHESVLVAGIFMNSIFYGAMIILQVLITALRSTRSEMLQTFLGVSMGYHFYWSVFQPAMVSAPTTITVVAHVMYAVNLLVIIFEKKGVLNLHTPLDDHLHEWLVSAERWVGETMEAMGNVFVENLPDVSESESDTFSESVSSICASETEPDDAYTGTGIGPRAKQGRYFARRSTVEVGAGRGYGRWMARNVGQASDVAAAAGGARWGGAAAQTGLMGSGSRRRLRGGESGQLSDDGAYDSCQE